MCGIAGLAAPGGLTADDVRPLIRTLTHRGPDACGTWTDGRCALGHRRLAIIDLSDAGRQPLASADAAIQVVFNGEIYNYLEVREELLSRGHQFRTGTDTEVIVEGYRAWGPDVVLHLDGMFAFGLWDAPARRLLLARDRVGKKPLYYARRGDTLVFASELQAILADGSIPRTVDRRAVDAYLSWGYVPPRRTAFEGICKLPPAHRMVIDVGTRELTTTIDRYWSLSYVPKTAMRFEDAAVELRAHLERAVRARLMSDVPLGAFLSGGIDSSIVVGLMARASARPVPTFSIGFSDARFNELPHARAIAARWATDHHEFIVEPDALAVLPELVRHHGEPFADSSSIPTYYLSRLSRQHVTVALSGDGGDESFAGYERYRALQAAARLERVPGAGRGAAALSRLLPDSDDPFNRVRRVKRFLGAASLPAPRRYSRWLQYFSTDRKKSIYSDEMRAVAAAADSDALLDSYFARELDVADAAMAADVDNYLPHDLMAKVDIASMANSLEVRAPLLDHRLMEFAARLPVHYKLSGQTSKRVLKAACADLLPPEIVSRGKMGFGVPIGAWFRASLKDFLRETLCSGPALSRGLFDPAAVRALVDEHVGGGHDHAHPIWNLLMLELWHREFIDRRVAAE